MYPTQKIFTRPVTVVGFWNFYLIADTKQGISRCYLGVGFVVAGDVRRGVGVPGGPEQAVGIVDEFPCVLQKEGRGGGGEKQMVLRSMF